MTITTSKGKKFDVNFAHAPTTRGNCIIELLDSRAAVEIAKDFEGLEWLKRESEEQGNEVYEGYSYLQSITRKPSGVVLLSLAKP